MRDGMRGEHDERGRRPRGERDDERVLRLRFPDEDPALDQFAERIGRPLRTVERADDTFRERVMSSVRAEAVTNPPRPVATAVPAAAATRAPVRVPWYRRAVTVRVTPLRGLAAAAAVAGVVVLVGRTLERRAGVAAPTSSAVAAAAPLPDTVRVVQFVFVAPGAKRVSLVGDFNAWDRDATQLRPGGVNDGVWTVSLALPAGRHEYAFVVDGTRWEPDPAATNAVTDDFGVVSSIVSVARTTSGSAARRPRLGVS